MASFWLIFAPSVPLMMDGEDSSRVEDDGKLSACQLVTLRVRSWSSKPTHGADKSLSCNCMQMCLTLRSAARNSQTRLFYLYGKR